MFNLTEEQINQLLSYMWARPYGEVAQHIAMLASLKGREQETIQEKKNDNGKKDVPKVSG